MSSVKIAGAGCPDTAPASGDEERIETSPADLSRHERARAWRRSKGLSRPELAELSGFSESFIRDIEAGRRRGKKPEYEAFDAATWLRYGLACAAVDDGLAPLF